MSELVGLARSESEFVGAFKALLDPALPDGHRLHIGMNLYYEVVVDGQLTIRTNVRRPMRGQSAFQTDLCLVEVISGPSGEPEIEVPRVVFEFKVKMTTHDVLTYTAKARKHKAVYPYLRYGLVATKESRVPGKFFTHNEAMDFCIALGNHLASEAAIRDCMIELMNNELAASKLLEQAAFGRAGPDLYRNEVILVHLPQPRP